MKQITPIIKDENDCDTLLLGSGAMGKLGVKTGYMIDTEFIHDDDYDTFEHEVYKLPRFDEYGISGAASFYVLFEYDNLGIAKFQHITDGIALEAILAKYKQRYDEKEAHPDIDGGSTCCGGYGANRDEFNDLTYDVDLHRYKCIECER